MRARHGRQLSLDAADLSQPRQPVDARDAPRRVIIDYLLREERVRASHKRRAGKTIAGSRQNDVSAPGPGHANKPSRREEEGEEASRLVSDGRMRVELALIAGIVCFCCWCAYILVRMNQSVVPSASQPQPQPQLQHQHQHQPNQVAAYHQPPAYHPTAAAAYTPRYLAAAAHQYPQQWRPPKQPNQRQRVHVDWAPPSELEPQEAESQAGQADQGEQQHPVDETIQDDEASQEDAEEEQPGGELEQRRGERRHHEQEWAASERDRQGRPLTSRRLHLVNGRPVKSSQRPQGDFERVVSEVDASGGREGEENGDDDGGQEQQAQEEQESRLVGASVGANGVTSLIPSDRKKTKKPKDSHQHRVSESLSAQQWDDDSPTAAASSSSTSGQKLHDGQDGQAESPRGADELVEAPDDGQQELAELELFANSDKFPFNGLAARRRRRSLDLLAAGDLNIEVLDGSTLVNASSPPATALGHPPTYYAPADSQQQQAPPVWSNGHQAPYLPAVAYTYQQPATSGGAHYGKTIKKRKKKTGKKRRKFKKSALAEGKQKEARAYWVRKASRHKKGGARRKRKGAKKRQSKRSKDWRAETRGRKSRGGKGSRGAKKGALYVNDKGYKKRGFKRHYRKLEAGDHKTYFDEFRDKDHNKRWKDFRDRHRYSQSKKWRGKEAKGYKDYKSKESSHKKTGKRGYKSKSASRAHMAKAKVGRQKLHKGSKASSSSA